MRRPITKRFFVAFAIGCSLSTVAAGQTSGKKYTVNPSMSIQATIDKAAPGDTVQVIPGDYSESITITKDGITLLGMSFEGDRAILKAKSAEEEEPLETAILVDADNVTVEGFVIRGFTKYGLLADNCSNLALRGLIIEGAGETGVILDDISTLSVDNVVIGDCASMALLVGDSTEVSIKNSEFFHSAFGIVLMDCEQTFIENCSAHDNAVGIAVTSTPPGKERWSGHCKITFSRVWGNRGKRPDGELYNDDIAWGVGILLAGADYTEIAHCLIEDNASFGVVAHSSIKNEDDRPAVPANHTYVHHNRYARNGTAPTEAFDKTFTFPEGASGDICWDEKGERNQFQEDGELKTYPENLVVEHGGVHTDVIHFL